MNLPTICKSPYKPKKKIKYLTLIFIIALTIPFFHCKNEENNPPSPPNPGEPGLVLKTSTDMDLTSPITLTEGTDTTYKYTIRLNTEPQDGNVQIAMSLSSHPNLSVSPIIFTFTPAGGTNEWNVPQMVTLTVSDDDIYVGNSTLILSHFIRGSSEYESLPDVDVSIDFVENEEMPISLPPSGEAGFIFNTSTNMNLPRSITLTEGTDTTYAYTIRLNTEPQNGNVEITVDLDDHFNVSISPLSITFTPGPGSNAWNVPKTVTLTVSDDDIYVGNSTLTVSYSISGSSEYASLPNTGTDLRINFIEDDPIPAPGIAGLVLDTNPITLTEGMDATHEYTVRLNAEPQDGNVVVAISSLPTPHPNVSVSPSSITFTTGQGSNAWNVPQLVTITVSNDDIYVGTSALTLSHSATGSPEYEALSDIDININFVDDEIPELILETLPDRLILPSTLDADEDNPDNQQYAIRLNGKPQSGNVVIEISLAPHPNVSVSPSVITFEPNEWNMAQTVTLTIVNDDDYVGNSTLTLSHSATGSPEFEALSDINININFVENDSVPLPGLVLQTLPDGNILSETVPIPVPEVNAMVQYTIKLNIEPQSGDVEVAISLAPHPNVSISPSTITFTAGGANAWNVPQPVTLTVVDDTVYLGDSTLTLSHSIAASSSSEYASLPDIDISLNFMENDPAPLPELIVRTSTNMDLPSSITLTEGTNANYTYSIVLNAAPQNGNVVIAFNLPSHPNVGISHSSFTFTPAGGANAWDVPQTVTLGVVDNDDFVGNSVLTLSHSITGSREYTLLSIANLTINFVEQETASMPMPIPTPSNVCKQSNSGTKEGFGGDYGDGTEIDPFIICNAIQLQAIKDNLGAHYELGHDINAALVPTNACHYPAIAGTCTGFQPIGNCGSDGVCHDAGNNERDDNQPFIGSLDGKGHTISGLRMNLQVTSRGVQAGLFGLIGSGSTVKNMGIINVNITASITTSVDNHGAIYVGALAGWNTGGTITGIYTTGTIASSTTSDSSVKTYNDAFAGGLVGGNQNGGTISNSYSNCTITCKAERTNRIASEEPRVQNSAACYAGGLVGRILTRTGSSEVNNSYSTGTVTSSAIYNGNMISNRNFRGGLIGRTEKLGVVGSLTVRNSYYDTTTTGITNIIGDSHSETIRTCIGRFTTAILQSSSNTPSSSTTCDNANPTVFFGWDPAIWDFTDTAAYPTLKAPTTP